MKQDINKHFIGYFIIFAFFILILIGVYYIYQNFDSGTSSTTGDACINDICIQLEVVKTGKDKERGLMYRDYLPQDHGMLFVFENKAKHEFWMKNTFISLDIIWINEDFEIVDIISAEPCTSIECEIYKPREEALYVIEVNKNFARDNNIFIGTEVDLNY